MLHQIYVLVRITEIMFLIYCTCITPGWGINQTAVETLARHMYLLVAINCQIPFEEHTRIALRDLIPVQFLNNNTNAQAGLIGCCTCGTPGIARLRWNQKTHNHDGDRSNELPWLCTDSRPRCLFACVLDHIVGILVHWLHSVRPYFPWNPLARQHSPFKLTRIL